MVGPRTPQGLFWARLPDIPDGMRVQLWLDTDGTRVRGAYSAVPYTGEIEGEVRSRDDVRLTFFERGVTRVVAPRTRSVVLRWDARARTLTGRDAIGGRIELVRAAHESAALRPGLWLGRWTGLPFGLAVETRITQTADGHWRAAYQYQGTGGVRDGSFEGTLDAQSALLIAWTELTESGTVARGRGRLLATPFGLRGTYGIDGSTEGTGEWVLEPLDP